MTKDIYIYIFDSVIKILKDRMFWVMDYLIKIETYYKIFIYGE